MSVHLSLVQFLGQQANRDAASSAIANATNDYDIGQDLVAHRKRNVRVHRNLEANSAMLLEDVKTKDGDETIEPTFVVAGTLVHANLPPILSKEQIPAQVMSASQEVSIMGADLAHFNDMIVAVEEIHEKFALEFPQGALLRNEVQNFDGELVLNFGTRYLTPPRVAKGDIALKIDRSIDPFGILEKAGGTRGKHLADNKVTYLARTIVSDGAKARWVTVQPGRFRTGQTVQLEVAFRAVPTVNRNAYRMVPLLRSIALLDSKLYMDWERVSKTARPTSVQVRYKRSTVYDTTDDSDAILQPAKRLKPNPKTHNNDEDSAKDKERLFEDDEEDMGLDFTDLEN